MRTSKPETASGNNRVILNNSNDSTNEAIKLFVEADPDMRWREKADENAG